MRFCPLCVRSIPYDVGVFLLQMKEQITGTEALVAQRRRLPRCIRGDGILTPFSVAPALGLALLHNSGVGPLSSLVKGAGTGLSLSLSSSLGSGTTGGSSSSSDGVSDAYEAHLTLPMGNVAMITNYRLLMLSAPEFAVLEADVLSGRKTHVRPKNVCDHIAADPKAVGCMSCVVCAELRSGHSTHHVRVQLPPPSHAQRASRRVCVPMQ